MKKYIVILVAIAIMPFVSIRANVGKNIESNNLTESILANSSDNDWQPIGVMEIAKNVGRNVPGTQKVQVYSNSDGDRAIKDKYGYHKLEENRMYGKYSKDECFEAGYRYKIFYEGEYWYTNGIVKKS